MATIALYSAFANQMSSQLKSVIGSVTDLQAELFSLNANVLTIPSSICNMDDVIESVQVSTRTQEQKINNIDTLDQHIEEFIEDVAEKDNSVAEIVSQNKNDFYAAYSYLKPEFEKGIWEKFKDNCKKVGTWCKEHWKEILITVSIVIGAVLAIAAVIVSGGLALVPLLTALGLSASLATGISLGVAVIAVVSTIGSSVLNIIDTWYNIDDSSFKVWQKIFNWASIISNVSYSIGYIYNGINGITNADLRALDGNRLVNVTRWGRPGLESGDWVMRGKNTWLNYILSGKWDPGPWNQFALKSSGQTFQVLRRTLQRPLGMGIDGIIKTLVGQWRYFP